MVCIVVMYMWELDYKESWEMKNWCFWTVVLERTLESPLNCKEIQLVNPKVTGRTDAEAADPILCPPDAKSWLTRKDSDAGKDWCWSWNSNPLANWYEELTHLKRPWCWERLRAGGEGDDRWWDGWMASPTQRTWVWVNSGNWWQTGRPDVLHSWGRKK